MLSSFCGIIRVVSGPVDLAGERILGTPEEFPGTAVYQKVIKPWTL